MQTAVTLQLSTVLILALGFINLLVIGPVAWILKAVVNDVRQLNKDVSGVKEEVSVQVIQIRENLHQHYVPSSLYMRDIQEVKDKLEMIFSKLDKKADKE